MIENEFPQKLSKLKIISKPDIETTGKFEIFLNGKLVHSKKHKGHGFFHNNAKQQVLIFDEIQKLLDVMDEQEEAQIGQQAKLQLVE
jgi:selT/selW/selH-like putative selenoprotein